MIVSEGGINWCWYTDLTVHEDKTVTINKHFRVHRGEKGHPKNAVHHPNYYHELVWKEAQGRVALEYFVPGLGWHKIRNPKKLFDYGGN